MSSDPRWTDETEQLLTRGAANHWIVFFPNSPDGLNLTASCRCGWSQFFNLEKEDDPSVAHCVQATLTVLADAGLLRRYAQPAGE